MVGKFLEEMMEKTLKCSTLLAIREITIKTIWEFHLTHVRRAKIKKKERKSDCPFWKGCEGCELQGILTHC